MTLPTPQEQAVHTPGCKIRHDILEAAVVKGYLGHTQDCQKGVTFKTCTCGVMAWLPTVILKLYACDCALLTRTAQETREQDAHLIERSKVGQGLWRVHMAAAIRHQASG